MDITSKDLRIGNLVHSNCHKGLVAEIHSIYSDKVKLWLNPLPFYSYKEISPIKLDENILLKCGFEVLYSSNFRLKLDHKDCNFVGYDFSHTPNKEMEGFTYYGKYIKCEYLHQLQNLYWCLVGKELEVNL